MEAGSLNLYRNEAGSLNLYRNDADPRSFVTLQVKSNHLPCTICHNIHKGECLSGERLHDRVIEWLPVPRNAGSRVGHLYVPVNE